MESSTFAAALNAAFRHRRLVLAGAAAALVLGLYALWAVPLDYDVSLMLPVEPEIQRSMTFLRESNLSDKVALSLGIERDAGGLDALLDASAGIEASLGPPLVTGVESGVDGEAALHQIREVLARVPMLAGPADLQSIEKRLTREGMNELLRAHYRRLVGPGELFLKETIGSDPLGLSRGLLGVMQDLPASVGYAVDVEGGKFVSRDRLHTLLVLETPVRITDSAGARDLFASLRRPLDALPRGVTADVVAGHLHTISNEDVLEHDLIVGLGATGLAFAAFFLLLYPDPRAMLLFLLPVASVVVAIGLAGLFVGKLSAFAIGMGGVVAGIADDYGIHVYMAIRAAGGDVRAVRVVAGPIAAASVTTLSVFLAFLFSSVSGYRQLALFSIASIGICVVSALFVLPLLVGGPGGRTLTRRTIAGVPRLSRSAGSFAIVAWAALVVAGLLTLRSLDVRTDLRQFDGSEPFVFEAEERFGRTWGRDAPPAVLVASGATLDEALRQNSLLFAEVAAVAGTEGFASIAPIWPPREERERNLERWTTFWRDGREKRLRELLAELGPQYGFAPTAFEAFLGRLSDGVSKADLSSAAIPSLARRFVRETSTGHHVLSFFPDDPRWLATVREIAGRQPGAFVVSRSGLGEALTRSVSSEVRFIATVAAILIPGISFLLLRSVRLTALSLVPVASSLIAVLALPTLLGWSLTAPAMIAALVVAGLSIDYGIFIVHACDRLVDTETTAAVTISAASTVIGTGALLLSSHPVLFSIGLTMVTGLTAGYATAVLVLPSLHDRFVGPAGAR